MGAVGGKLTHAEEAFCQAYVRLGGNGAAAYRAMILMGGSDESPITIQTAQTEYRRMFGTLCMEQLPPISLTRGNALA